ncbi:MAG: Hsp70 family protein, partial [Pirellulaceae bacterium]
EYGLHRVAVGKHLLLGGDNFDVALAKAVETDLLTSEATFAPDADDPSSPPTLTHRQWESLRGQCRQAKEQLLGEEGLPTYHLTVAGAGSRLLGKTLSRTLTRSRVQQVLIEGFFPQVPLSDRVQHSPTGLFEFGLPYESDPAITR